MSKPTGGPAFPGLNEEMTGISSDGIERYDVERSGGMTLRDYFAVHCEADLANYSIPFAEGIMGRPAPEFKSDALGNFKFWAEFRATLRYLEADAMLAERTK
ncbi:hypothetical protein [Herbaspirillum sp. RV1423]|uniref:hypothetical protein n=1 Tax=Herbaspirillum sp. RV1423 TaxID=1443993 RepID=UPI0004B6A6DC|nr:hypothetical protein [Herbaspirillum sp. RV1423]